MGAWLPGSTMGNTGQQETCVPFPQPIAPQGPQGPVYINWWVECCWITLISDCCKKCILGNFSVHSRARLCVCVHACFQRRTRH